MKRFRSGDPDAVRELYDAYGRSVFSVAYQALGDRVWRRKRSSKRFFKPGEPPVDSIPTVNRAPGSTQSLAEWLLICIGGSAAISRPMRSRR